ncbi:MAG: prolipoprotein diacylglyceryl transferase [Terracidiphilus sp.]|nr:prolipoprotein diacylglyceryl transferase [Terracidiphilus sp.]
MVPALLVLWAHGSASVIQLPALHWTQLGLMLIFVGVALLLAGMLALWRRGGGLPMNAFPPPRFVVSGVYALVPHPIYGGFVTACIGVALYAGSASGLWLVSPSVALACAALVLGYELPDLRKRFGKPQSSMWLPTAQPGYGSLLERLRIYPVILLPWFVLFEGIGMMGKAPDAVSTYLPFERSLPIVEPLELVYISTYLVVLLAPVAIPSATALRGFALHALRAMALMFPLYLLLPFYVPPRPFVGATPFAVLMHWERSPISGVGAFPSFHIVWALIAAEAFGQGGRTRRFLWSLWAVLVGVSCVATGMHSVLDVLAGAVVCFAAMRFGRIWCAILRAAEWLANSWVEWRIGSLRIINHGVYAGLGSFVGICIVDTLLGPGHIAVSFGIFVCSTVCAALWAQWVEGSPALLRPMGFYGGMIGALIGALIAPLQGVSLWAAFTALAVAAPWIQALGRLRCLVQGCCHGHATDQVPGICYRHPRTRVYRLAHLAGIPIHATPVYSILCNVVVGLALLRLVRLHVPGSLLCGVYLLLTSAGRFVEEAYRGEPQTKIIYGLRMYQWIAIVTAVAGAAILCIPSGPLVFQGPMRLSTFGVALACGLGSWFATGMDFPESSRRFARLT